MSVLTFRDQHNQPVWGLATRIARGKGDTTKAEDERYPDKAGTTAFVGVKLVLPADGHTVHVNYNEGLNPDWRNYESVSVFLPDIEAIPSGYTITVPKKGAAPGPTPPPGLTLTTFPHPSVAGVFGYGTSAEMKALCQEWVRKNLGPNAIMEPNWHEGGNGKQPNLAAYNAFLRSIPVPAGFTTIELQNAERGEGELKPRQFLSTSDRNHWEGSPSGPFSRIIDIGSFGRKFFHNETSSDEWVRTPPSW